MELFDYVRLGSMQSHKNTRQPGKYDTIAVYTSGSFKSEVHTTGSQTVESARRRGAMMVLLGGGERSFYEAHFILK
jgi:hypothetical protein